MVATKPRTKAVASILKGLGLTRTELESRAKQNAARTRQRFRREQEARFMDWSRPARWKTRAMGCSDSTKPSRRASAGVMRRVSRIKHLALLWIIQEADILCRLGSQSASTIASQILSRIETRRAQFPVTTVATWLRFHRKRRRMKRKTTMKRKTVMMRMTARTMRTQSTKPLRT